VLVVDIDFPNRKGIEFVSRLKSGIPELQIIVLTLLDDDESVFNSIRAGANGYLLKRSPDLQLVDAIYDLHRGGAPMTGSIARRALRRIHGNPLVRPDDQLAFKNLSPREKEVMVCLCDGLRYKEIASALHIGIETVHTHLQRCYRKFHVTSRTEAVVKFLRYPEPRRS
jgi:DNA-binding NarL/FixJ family response regulator